jgi:hypothetical protein
MGRSSTMNFAIGMLATYVAGVVVAGFGFLLLIACAV